MQWEDERQVVNVENSVLSNARKRDVSAALLLLLSCEVESEEEEEGEEASPCPFLWEEEEV
jgi:hypothetical protein